MQCNVQAVEWACWKTRCKRSHSLHPNSPASWSLRGTGHCFHLFVQCELASGIQYFDLHVQMEANAQPRAKRVVLWQRHTNGGRVALFAALSSGAALYDLSVANCVQSHEGEHTTTLCMYFGWLISEAMKRGSLRSLQTDIHRISDLMDSSMRHRQIVYLVQNQQWSSYHFGSSHLEGWYTWAMSVCRSGEPVSGLNHPTGCCDKKKVEGPRLDIRSSHLLLPVVQSLK